MKTHRRHYCGITRKFKDGCIILSSSRSPRCVRFLSRGSDLTLEELGIATSFVCKYRHPESELSVFDIMIVLFPTQIKDLAKMYVDQHGGFQRLDYDRDLVGIKATRPIIAELDRRGKIAFEKTFAPICGCTPTP